MKELDGLLSDLFTVCWMAGVVQVISIQEAGHSVVLVETFSKGRSGIHTQLQVGETFRIADALERNFQQKSIQQDSKFQYNFSTSDNTLTIGNLLSGSLSNTANLVLEVNIIAAKTKFNAKA